MLHLSHSKRGIAETPVSSIDSIIPYFGRDIDGTQEPLMPPSTPSKRFGVMFVRGQAYV